MIKFILIAFLVVVSFISSAQQKSWLPYKNAEGKWSFISPEGEQLNNEFFDSISYTDYAYGPPILVQREEKWGFLGASGEYILPIQYDSISFLSAYSQYLVLVGNKRIDGKWLFGLFDPNGQEILAVQFSSIKMLEFLVDRNRYKIAIIARNDAKKSNSYGLYSRNGEQLLPHDYCELTSVPANQYAFDGTEYCVYASTVNDQGDTVTGAFNLGSDNWVFPCKYPYRNFNNGFGFRPLVGHHYSMLFPLIDQTYVHVFTEYDYRKRQSCYDFYKLNGEFMFNSSNFDIDPDFQGRYYVVGDSIIGRSQAIEVIKLCDSLDLFQLRFGASSALYDLNKGFVIDSAQFVFKSHSSDPCKDGFIIAQSLLDNSVVQLHLDGTPYLEKIDSSTVMYKDGLVVRDTSGNWVDMDPYFVQSKIKLDPKFGDCYIATMDRRVGVVNIDKQIIIPFKYDFIYHKVESELIVMGDMKFTFFKDLQLKTILRVKRNEWKSTEERFMVIEGKRTTKIFDEQTRDFIIRGVPKVSHALRDSLDMYEVDLDLRMRRCADSLLLLQLFHPENGWEIYDQTGKKLLSAPEFSFEPMYPIIDRHNFVGIIYPTGYDGSFLKRYIYEYAFFSGIRLEGLDSVTQIYFDSPRGIISAYDRAEMGYIFSKEGKFVIKFWEHVATGNDPFGREYDIFKLENGNFVAVDSNLRTIFDDEYSSLRGNGLVFVGTRDDHSYLLISGSEKFVSKPFERILHLNWKLFICHIDSEHFEVYNTSGEVVFTNGTLFDYNRLYSIIQANGVEYWINNKGEIYAQHPI